MRAGVRSFAVLALLWALGCSGSPGLEPPGGSPNAMQDPGGAGVPGMGTGGAGGAGGGGATSGPGGEGQGAPPDGQGMGSPPAMAPSPSSDGGPSADAGIDDAGAPIDPPQPTGCVTDVRPGVHELACDGTTHVVTVPERCTEVACGVIVDVHGGSMSADMEDKNTELRALGRQHGYLVIQPNALPNALLLGSRVFVAADDDPRVLRILTDVIAAFHADERRIHMMGFSEGGFMTWRFLCAHGELFASVAPAAAGWNCTVLPITEEIGCELTGAAKPARNIPVLYMQGEDDMLMSPQCVFDWLQGNVYPTLGLDSGTQIAGDDGYSRTRFLDPDGVPFELIRHRYTTDASFFGVAVGGHCYPGSTDFDITLPGQLMGFGCKSDCAFDWAEEAVKFFIAHPKR